MKKEVYFLVFAIGMFLIFLFSLAIPGVSASFACGRVNDSNDFSAVGFYVKVYYQENPALSTSCKVATADNKYCCDLEDIRGVIWKAGKTVNAEVISDEGYSSQQVSLVTSGEGFDVFPEMGLIRVINIYPELKDIYVNTTSVFVNISTPPGYNKISYKLYYNGTKIKNDSCDNCNNFQDYLSSLSYGKYSLDIIASNGKEVSKTFNFSLLKYLNFEREIECVRCRNLFVPSNSDVNITIFLNASEQVSGMLFDYFSNDWELKGNDSSEEYSESHNSIIWEVSGKEIAKTYTLHSPKSYYPKKYTFQSEFEGIKSSEIKIKTFFFNFPIQITKKVYNPFSKSVYYKISNSTPLILRSDNGTLRMVAIFPKKEVKKAFALVNVNEKKKTFDIISNIPNNNIDKILIRFSLNKTEINGRNVSLEGYSIKGKFPAIIYSEDNSSVIYESYLNKKGKFKVVFY